MKLLDLILKLHSIKAAYGDLSMYVYDTGFNEGYNIKDVQIPDRGEPVDGYIVV